MLARLVPSQVRGLGLKASARLGRDVLERRPEACCDRGRDRPLHERGLGEPDPGARLVGQQVERRLGAEDGAPEVHEDQHPVAAVRTDRAEVFDFDRVDAQPGLFEQFAGGSLLPGLGAVDVAAR